MNQINNDDLELIAQQIEERKHQVSEPAAQPISEMQLVKPVTEQTTFSKAVDDAKIEVVKEAAATDQKFIKDFTDELKKATIKSAQVEQEKQALEKQNVLFAQELLETQQKLNEAEQQVNEWEKRQKRRQYHYDGVKPIMEFVGIQTPMNLFLLYFLTSILVWFFLLSKLFRGTIGAIIVGADNEDRPKAVKAFLWTLLGAIAFVPIVLLIFTVLKQYGFI